MQYSFVDLDELIELNELQSIEQIFEEKGEVFFRNLEHKYLQKTTNINNVIISCGGGTPCYNNNMNLINENGISIFINAKNGILVDRILNAKKQRPLFLDLDKAQIEKKVDELLLLRMPFYEQAKFTFFIPQETVQSFVNKAVQAISEVK